MKPNNKRKSGLLYQKVIKKAPLYEPRLIREMPKRIYQPIEVPNFTSQPPLKPMDPRVETSWSPEEVVVDKNSRAGNDLIIQKNPLQELPKFEMPEFKPLRGKAKRQFKRENIQRVADKYGITRGQARRGLRKMRRAGEDYIPQEYLSSLKMVKRNSAVPFKLPHQSNSALPNVELSQAVKDSLHNQANLYGKPFFSPKYGVNVDPEDGVLSNRPTFKPELDDFSKLPVNERGGYSVEELESLYPLSEGRKLTYPKINKPHSNAAPKQVVSSSGGDDTIDYSNMTPQQKASLADFWKSEIEAYGGIEPGSEGYTELVGANRYAVYDRGRFNPRNQTYQFDKPQWRMKGGGPEYDNPKGIHPDQLMRMYQGDDNVYE